MTSNYKVCSCQKYVQKSQCILVVHTYTKILENISLRNLKPIYIWQWLRIISISEANASDVELILDHCHTSFYYANSNTITTTCIPTKN